jgi:hypothetical protein
MRLLLLVRLQASLRTPGITGPLMIQYQYPIALPWAAAACLPPALIR